MRIAFVAIIGLTFMGCKVEDQNSSNNTSGTQQGTPSAQGLTLLNEGVKLNPDDALVVVDIVGSNNENGAMIYEAKVIAVEKIGFGFSDNLKSGDIININAGNSSMNTKDVKCIISKLIKPNQDGLYYKLVKLI